MRGGGYRKRLKDAVKHIIDEHKQGRGKETGNE